MEIIDILCFIDNEANELDKEEEAGGYSFKSILERDKRRWKGADTDGDGALTRSEFFAFLHPNEREHMKDIVVLEAVEDIDKDKDGKISLDEYIGISTCVLQNHSSFFK